MKLLSLDIWSILILIAIAQGLYVCVLLLLKKGIKSRPNLFLFFILGTFLWFQLEFLFIRQKINVGFDMFYGIRYGSWLIVGPLFYFYVQSIRKRKRQKWTSYLLHFLPAFIFVLIIPFLTTNFLSFRQVHYGMLTSFDEFNKEVSFLQYVYSSIFILQFVHLFGYLLLSRKAIDAYKTDLQQEYANINENNIRWLQVLSVVLMIILISATIFLAIFFYTQIYRRHLDYLYVLPMGFLMYLVGFRLAEIQWLAPKVINTEPANGSSKKYEKSSLKSSQAYKYADQLQQYLKVEKPYLRNNLKLSELAEELDIPYHHLSQVLNDQLSTTFFDYINRFRIEEAKRLIVAKPDSVLLEIAFQAGFNNKTSFTNAFKKFEKLTPSEYRKQQLGEKVGELKQSR